MSISYCEKHDISHDEDHQIECLQCEAENVEAESDLNSLENLIKATGWKFHTSGTNEERAKANARRAAGNDHLLYLDADPTRHGALLSSAWAGWYLDEYNKLTVEN